MVTAVAMSCGGSDHRAGMAEIKPVKVQVAKATMKNTGEFINASGKVEAQKSANLSTRMMGHVNQLTVAVGQRVKKGDLLIAINSSDLYAKKAQVESGIKQAESALKNAEKDYNRFKSLYEKGSASEKELDDMTTRYEMAKAGLESAIQMKREVEAQFSYTNIRAPFNGVVTNTFVKEGDMASPGMPLVTVEGDEQYEATVMVSEAEISKVAVGDKATVMVKSIDQSFQGKVSEVSMSAKNTGGQYLVTIEIPEAGEEVLPGMFVNARLFPSETGQSGKLMIPASALVIQGQLKGVYTITNDNKALLRWLRTGKANNDMIEVLSGLSEGESYVMTAQGKLFNGAPVDL